MYAACRCSACTHCGLTCQLLASCGCTVGEKLCQDGVEHSHEYVQMYTSGNVCRSVIIQSCTLMVNCSYGSCTLHKCTYMYTCVTCTYVVLCKNSKMYTQSCSHTTCREFQLKFTTVYQLVVKPCVMHASDVRRVPVVCELYRLVRLVVQELVSEEDDDGHSQDYSHKLQWEGVRRCIWRHISTQQGLLGTPTAYIHPATSYARSACTAQVTLSWVR